MDHDSTSAAAVAIAAALQFGSAKPAKTRFIRESDGAKSYPASRHLVSRSTTHEGPTPSLRIDDSRVSPKVGLSCAAIVAGSRDGPSTFPDTSSAD
jgi:hypothetical protein